MAARGRAVPAMSVPVCTLGGGPGEGGATAFLFVVVLVDYTGPDTNEVPTTVPVPIIDRPKVTLAATMARSPPGEGTPGTVATGIESGGGPLLGGAPSVFVCLPSSTGQSTTFTVVNMVAP